MCVYYVRSRCSLITQLIACNEAMPYRMAYVFHTDGPYVFSELDIKQFS